MLIRLGYDIRFATYAPTPIVALLNVYPDRAKDLLENDQLSIEPEVKVDEYFDSFGNRCCRFVAPPGGVRLFNSTLIKDSGQLDEVHRDAVQHPIGELPTEVLQFLLASRYCEVDLMSNIAGDLFSQDLRGWPLVEAICSWVYNKVQLGYPFARSTRQRSRLIVNASGCAVTFNIWP